jgi:hypothetical protein
MRVRLRFDPRESWVVERKHWYEFTWRVVESFIGDHSYARVYMYARTLKRPHIEEIA